MAAACGPGAPASVASQPDVNLAGHLQMGAHRVGFRTETLLFPLAATGEADLPSAVDLYLWYPVASPGRGGTVSSMVLGDYYRAQEDAEPSTEELREWLRDDMTSPPGVETATLTAVIEAPMWAARDADRAEGSHPLVLWSYRDSVPTKQALLNEYLASHGYVVAFAWPRDHVPPFPWKEGLTPLQKRRALGAQVGMLEKVLDALSRRACVQTSFIV